MRPAPKFDGTLRAPGTSTRNCDLRPLSVVQPARSNPLPSHDAGDNLSARPAAPVRCRVDHRFEGLRARIVLQLLKGRELVGSSVRRRPNIGQRVSRSCPFHIPKYAIFSVTSKLVKV